MLVDAVADLRVVDVHQGVYDDVDVERWGVNAMMKLQMRLGFGAV